MAVAAICVGLAAATSAQAQTAPQPVAPQPAAPIESAPLPPPVAAPAAPSPAPAPAAPAPAPAAPSFAAYPTLVGPSPNPADVDEVTLPPKSALATEGQAIWDDGFRVLGDAFRKLLAEANRAGLRPAGKPLARFIDTNDEGFRFEALLPTEAPPTPATGLEPAFKMSMTPQGKAMRFVHKAPYDEIDSTYEAITAYLDARGIVVEDSFTEEYVSDMTNAADPELEINIFVVPKP